MNQQPPQEPKPEYILVNDVTGKPPKPRGPTVINAYGHEIKVPSPPNSKCKRCYGRGYIGKEASSQLVRMCRKCYPML